MLFKPGNHTLSIFKLKKSLKANCVLYLEKMEKLWEDEAPEAVFFRKLLNSRVDQLITSPEWLQSLRYNNDQVRWWQKRAGYIFEERGLNLYELIAAAHGECWDDEDEEKARHAAKENVLPPKLKTKNPDTEKNAVRVDHSREIRLRQGKEEECQLHVRSGDERRQIDLQKRRGREELYRRAGGCRSPKAT